MRVLFYSKTTTTGGGLPVFILGLFGLKRVLLAPLCDFAVVTAK